VSRLYLSTSSTNLLEDQVNGFPRKLQSTILSESHVRSFAGQAFVFGTGACYAPQLYSTKEMKEAFHRQREMIGDMQYDQIFADRVFCGCNFDTNSVCAEKKDLFRFLPREEYLQTSDEVAHVLGTKYSSEELGR
jgi:hypothetical protein